MHGQNHIKINQGCFSTRWIVLKNSSFECENSPVLSVHHSHSCWSFPFNSLFSSRPFNYATTSPITTHHSVYETALLKKLCMNTSVANCQQHKRWKTLLNDTEATNRPNWRTRVPFAFSRHTCLLRSVSGVLQKGSICEVGSSRRTHGGLQVLKIF